MRFPAREVDGKVSRLRDLGWPAAVYGACADSRKAGLVGGVGDLASAAQPLGISEIADQELPRG